MSGGLLWVEWSFGRVQIMKWMFLLTVDSAEGFGVLS